MWISKKKYNELVAENEKKQKQNDNLRYLFKKDVRTCQICGNVIEEYEFHNDDFDWKLNKFALCEECYNEIREINKETKSKIDDLTKRKQMKQRF